MNVRIQRICAWTGPALLIVFFAGFAGIAHWMPPPDPLAGPNVIAAIYRARPAAILAGQAISMTAIGFVTLWAAAIGAQMKRMTDPTLANAQVALAAISTLVFIWPQFFWVTAAYRPDRDPSQLLLLNDMGWLPFVANVYTGVPWVVTIGWAILSDRRAEPIFPRWAGYYCFAVAAVFLPASLSLFFKHGPFSWNGLVVFWLIFTDFAVFLLLMTYLLLRAIKRQAAELTPSKG